MSIRSWIASIVISVAALVGAGAWVHAQVAQVPPRLGGTCLHGTSEQPADQLRREQAFRFAVAIDRAETGGLSPRTSPYLPFDQLRNLPPEPSGFSVQFNTDGRTYTFSLKDTLDSCHFAIFSDQDGRIYQGLPTTGAVEARVRPLELP